MDLSWVKLTHLPKSYAIDSDILIKLDGVKFDQLSRPNVTDSSLESIVNQLWKEWSEFWNWWTADAIRFELATWLDVGWRTHIIKWKERMTNLDTRLKNNPTASSNDYNAASDMYNDLKLALNWN